VTAATDLGYTAADVTAAFTAVGVACGPDGGGGGSHSPDGVLTNGVPATGLFGTTGTYVKYTMVVPAGATGLSFVTSGGTGDADMYVKFGSEPTDSVYDCRPYTGGNAETCSFANAQAGTYYVNLKGYSSYSGVTLVGSYTAGGGGGTQTYTNSTVTPIPDKSSITSNIVVSGRTGNAPTTSKVSVNITHPQRGDIGLTLVAPDGSSYVLKGTSKNDSADNIVATYTVNLSSEALNGTWKLKVQDKFGGNTGTLQSWSIQF